MFIMSSVQEVLVQCLGLLRNAKVVAPATKGLNWLHTLLVLMVRFGRSILFCLHSTKHNAVLIQDGNC